MKPSTTVGRPRESCLFRTGGGGKRRRSLSQCGRQAAAKDKATGWWCRVYSPHSQVVAIIPSQDGVQTGAESQALVACGIR